jgi:hypothetical protein
MMRRQDAKALGCLSFLVGGLLSIFIPIFLIGSRIYSDALWIILMPGWVIFRPGRDDGFEILMATILDTIIYGALIYGIIYGLVRFVGKAKYE